MYNMHIVIACSLQAHSLAHLPAEPANPYLQISSLPMCAHLTRVGGLRLDKCIQAHDYAASWYVRSMQWVQSPPDSICTTYSIALHPSKSVLATGSDDHTWKLWALSECVYTNTVYVDVW